MSTAADRYRRLSERFTKVVDTTPHGAWDRPSPCEGWTALDVLAHVVSSEWDFLVQRGLTPEGVAVPDDPREGWPVVRATVQGVLDDPARAGATYDGFFGPTTVEATLDRFYNLDLLVHAWDLARATGAPGYEPMPAEEIERVRSDTEALGPALRSPNVCGPEVVLDDPASVSDEERLLAFLGRDPR